MKEVLNMLVHRSIQSGAYSGSSAVWNEGEDFAFKEGAFEGEEEKCFNLFTGMTEFHRALNTMHIWEGCYGQRVDTVSTDVTGGTVFFELKSREPDVLLFKDFYIEPKKYRYLKRLYEHFRTPVLYVNFIEAKDRVYVWNIGKVDRYYEHHNVKIKSPVAACGYIVEDRYGLDTQDAYVFQLDGTLVRRPYDGKLTRGRIRKVDVDFEATTTDREILNRI